ncbi:MAG: hypothetical protein ACSLFI_07510 [Solirubrobacterales bacterium]
MCDVLVVESGHSGHRLAYVAAIGRVAEEAGLTWCLVTTTEARSSAEFQTHLSRRELNVHERPPAEGWRERLRLIRSARARLIVIPEADKYLAPLVVAVALRMLACPCSIVVMRPPARGGLTASWFKGLVKRLLVTYLSRVSKVQVHLLDDPLAGLDDTVWTGPPFRRSMIIHDPFDLAGDPLAGAGESVGSTAEPYLTVVGVIDERKEIPEIFEAWQLSGSAEHGRLLIAGKSTGEVEPLLRDTPTGVEVVDRYLSNPELVGTVRAARGLIVLYDGNMSSGVLTMAAAAGTPVIVRAGTRTARVAVRHGFGFAADAGPSALGRVMREVLMSAGREAPVRLPPARDFGRRILSPLLDLHELA